MPSKNKQSNKRPQRKHKNASATSGEWVPSNSRRGFVKPIYHPTGSGPELKVMDTVQSTGVVIYSGGSSDLINPSIEALDVFQDRIGRKITMKHICVKGYYGNTSVNLTSGHYPNGGQDVIKVAVVFDKQSNGGTPAYSTIYQNSANFCAPLSPPNISNTSRFMILGEKMLRVCYLGPNSVEFEFEIECDLVAQYNAGNTGTITDISTGGLFLVYAGCCDSAVTNVGNLFYHARVVFRDT